jgi:hypothetical protein
MIRVTYIDTHGQLVRESFADAVDYGAKYYDSGDTFVVLYDEQGRIVASYDPLTLVSVLSGAQA